MSQRLANIFLHIQDRIKHTTSYQRLWKTSGDSGDEKVSNEKISSSSELDNGSGEALSKKIGDESSGELIARIHFSHREFRKKDFRNKRFSDLNALKGHFESCDFSYSIFERAYFRNATFSRCIFRGCRFEDCNFKGATLTSCDMGYANFSRTLCDPKEIIASLPLEPNLRRDLLQNLRANAVEVGDYGAQRLYVLQEIEARKDHLWRAMHNSGDYYRKKYGGFVDRARAAVELGLLNVGGWIWGNGERPLRMVNSAVTLLILFSLVNFWAVLPKVSWSEALYGMNIFRYSLDQFLDAQPNAVFKGFVIIDYALLTMRYVYIGLFISVLAKLMSHR